MLIAGIVGGVVGYAPILFIQSVLRVDLREKRPRNRWIFALAGSIGAIVGIIVAGVVCRLIC